MIKNYLTKGYCLLYNVTMKIIKQLEQYRLENRLSQTVLADRLGISYATVNRWFNGHTKPNKMQTYHIEKLLRGGK